MTDAHDQWRGSPFAWILTRPSRQRGKIGEDLVTAWLRAKGVDVRLSGSTEFDRHVNGHRVEIKFSTLWQSGRYTFQQIRDQAYDYLICLGISPFDAHSWVLSKAILHEYVIGHLGQHTGAGGTDTAWFSVRPDSPPAWLTDRGGSLSRAYEMVLSLDNGP